MNKYNNSNIYRIDVIGCEKVYIGSCCISLNKRFSIHKRDITTCSSTELFTYGEPVITLIEKYSCNSKVELRMREQYYMDKFIDDGYTLVNKRRAYTSPEMIKEQKKEYNEIHKEAIKEQQKEYHKEYYETNKDKLTEKFTCECGGRYIYNNIVRHLKTKKHILYLTSSVAK